MLRNVLWEKDLIELIGQNCIGGLSRVRTGEVRLEPVSFD